MFTKILTLAHCEKLCKECMRMLDAGGISRQIHDRGDDVITPDMVRGRAPAPRATRCTWCGPESSWLSARMIGRLGVADLEELEGRLRSRARKAELRVQTGTVDDVPRAMRAYAVLGRFMALVA